MLFAILSMSLLAVNNESMSETKALDVTQSNAPPNFSVVDYRNYILSSENCREKAKKDADYFFAYGLIRLCNITDCYLNNNKKTQLSPVHFMFAYGLLQGKHQTTNKKYIKNIPAAA